MLGVLIRDERMALGLSMRDLATLADVSYPTISRIENGQDQPRWDTLSKLSAALGKRLVASFEDLETPRLADIADHGAEPDWTRLRGLIDHLRLQPELTGAAIADAPPLCSPLIDNLLAGVAEKLADDIGIQRPKWAAGIPPLSERWEAPARPSRRAANAASTPSQLAERNIVLPASAIWREHELVTT
jgi:transcriptional regulator with XRE-family HTH domain